MTTGIYKIYNKKNGKCYIGQSVNIERRWREHKARHRNVNSDTYESHLYRAFRAYGLKSFVFDILEICSVDQLNDREQFWISENKSLFIWSGYNMSLMEYLPSRSKLSISQVEEISILLSDSRMTNAEIGKIYGLTHVAVSGINTGYRWKRDIQYPIRKVSVHNCEMCGCKVTPRAKKCLKCTQLSARKAVRPEKDSLIRLIKEKGFAGVGREFGVSHTSVSRWCKYYQIPHTLSGLIDYV